MRGRREGETRDSLEHTAPMSAECALARAFLAWRKQLEQLRTGPEWEKRRRG
jgi:hypothetical protein